jgi:hypothetical protein
MFMSRPTPSHAAADAAPPEPSAADQRRAARALVEGQMAALTRLAEIGMEIAEAAGRQASAPDGGGALVDPGLTYSRAARAVRLTFALQTRLARDLAGLGRDEKHARRRRIHHLVKHAIDTEQMDEAEAEAEQTDDGEQLSAEAWERLNDDESLEDLAGLSLGEAVALICKDLGVCPDWSALAVQCGVADPWASPLDEPNPNPLSSRPEARDSGLESRDPGDQAAPGPLGPGSPPRGVRDDSLREVRSG